MDQETTAATKNIEPSGQISCQESSLEVNPEGKVSLFLHGIHPFATLQDIIDTFSPICQISNIKFKRNRMTGKHKGYAFFDVESMEVAQKLMDTGHMMLDREVHCDLKTNNRSELRKGNLRRIFVGGLGNSTTNKDLEKAFGSIGKVRAAYIIKNLQGQSRGFGYVDFFSTDDAVKAANSKKIQVKGKFVDIRPFSKKNSERGNEHPGPGGYQNHPPNGFNAGMQGVTPYNPMGNNNSLGYVNPQAYAVPQTFQPQQMNPQNQVPQAAGNFSSIEESFFTQMMMVFQSGMMIGAAQAQAGGTQPNWNGGQQMGQVALQKFKNEVLLKKQIMSQESRSAGNINAPLGKEVRQTNNDVQALRSQQGLEKVLELNNGLKGPKLSKKKRLVSLDFDICREKNTLKEILMTSLVMRRWEDVRNCYFFRMRKTKGRRRFKRKRAIKDRIQKNSSRRENEDPEDLNRQIQAQVRQKQRLKDKRKKKQQDKQLKKQQQKRKNKDGRNQGKNPNNNQEDERNKEPLKKKKKKRHRYRKNKNQSEKVQNNEPNSKDNNRQRKRKPRKKNKNHQNFKNAGQGKGTHKGEE